MAFDKHRGPDPANYTEPTHMSQALDIDAESAKPPSKGNRKPGGSKSPAGPWPTTRDYTYEPGKDPFQEIDYRPSPKNPE